MKKLTVFGKFITMLYIVIQGTLLAGWGLGAYKFFTSDFEPSYKREIVYGVGMVTGFNCVLGYFNFEDEKKVE